jgi:predicted anti-sigma-YlaC factor YlaD
VHNSGPPYHGHSASEFDVTADEVTCRQFVELVTDYFEGALQPRTMSQVEEHLVLCDWCVTYVEQMQATIASLRELEEQRPTEPPDSVLAALRAKRATEA